MKQIVQKLCIILAMLGLSSTLYAYDFAVDGIYYNKLSDGKSVEVTYKSYGIASYYGSVTIPSRVTYNNITYSITGIGEISFCECTDLISVTIPNSVTYIGHRAFEQCTNLTTVTIPNSVTSIGSAAFSECTGLTSVTIPNSVSSIAEGVFAACKSLQKLIVQEGNMFYDSRDNCNAIITTKTNELICGCNSSVIPNSVTSIGYEAFCGCTGLTSVTIPNSVTSIDSYAFYGCTGLTSVTIGDSVTSIGNDAFKNCSGLTYVKITDIVSWCEIKFSGSYSNPLYCAHHLYIGDNEVTDLIIPSTVTFIGKLAFSGCSGLTSVTIPNSVTSIGDWAFSGCSGLTSVTIPNSVTKIGGDAFRDCSGLTSVTIGNSVTYIGEYAFASCNIAKIIWLPTTPPSGYKTVDANIHYVANDNYVFNNQIKYQFLGSLFTVDGTVYVPVIPSERTCDAIDCTYSPEYKSIVIEDKIYNKGVEMTVLNVNPYTYFNNSNIESIAISNQGEVGEYAFGNCASLTDIEISKSVSSIGDYAFTNCLALCNITIEDCDVMLLLGSNGSSPLFVDCPLNDVYIGRELTYDKPLTDACYSPFDRNTSLRTVEFSNNATQICDYEFYGCSGLQSLKIGESVSKIGDKAFSGCTSLTSFTSNAAVPPTCGSQALDDINKWECTLYVPAESIEQYKVADQWKEFFFIEESGIEDIIVDADSSDCPIEIFNLAGVKVGNSTEDLAPGTYVIKQGRSVTKQVIH